MKNIKTNTNHFLALLYLILLCHCFFLNSCIAPFDKPDFQKKDWVELEIHYSLIKSNHELVGRTMTISGDPLKLLNDSFHPKDIRGMSVGSSATSVLTMGNGERWLFEFGSPDRIYFCLKTNQSRSYVADMADKTVYDTLRKLCYEHEKTLTPDVRIENICMCIGGKLIVSDEDCEPLEVN